MIRTKGKTIDDAVTVPPREYTKETRTVLEDWMIIDSVAYVQTYKYAYTRAVYIRDHISDRFGYDVTLDVLIDRLNRLDGVALYRRILPGYAVTYTEYWIHPGYRSGTYSRFYTEEHRVKLLDLIKKDMERKEEHRVQRNERKREYDRKRREEEKVRLAYEKALKDAHTRRLKARETAKVSEHGQTPLTPSYVGLDVVLTTLEVHPERVLYLDTAEFDPDQYNADVTEIAIYNGTGKVVFSDRFGTFDNEISVNHERDYSLGGVAYTDIQHLNPLLTEDGKRRILGDLLQNANVIVGYSVGFDLQILRTNGVNVPDRANVYDLMLGYARVVGRWSDYWNEYEYQPLRSAIRSYVEPGRIDPEGKTYLMQCVESFPLILSGISSEPEEIKNRPNQ